MSDPRRGEVWLIDLGDPVGHEAGLVRPALVVSDDRANTHGLVVVCPITGSRRGYPTHIEIDESSSGMDSVSYVQTEQIRTLSTRRLVHRLGSVDSTAIAHVDRALRFLLRL